MAGIGHVAHKQARSLGDAAVDGLFGGLAAGVLMGIYLFVLVLVQGKAGAEVLGVLVIDREITPATTVLIHLAISGIYGLVFGMGVYLYRPAREFGVRYWKVAGLGLLYGLALALVARTILLPGSGSYMESLEWLPLAGAHGLYGLSLGVFTGLGRRTVERS
jgi:hypothetical protein